MGRKRGRRGRGRGRDKISELPADRNRIGELPADILDKILVLLPIEEVARIAVLSTHLRDAWLNLTVLDFGYDFFCHILEKYDDAEKKDIDIWTSMGFYIINKILMQHTGELIRKFFFDFSLSPCNEFSYRSFGFDQWLPLVTQKGVEEIHFNVDSNPDDQYKLPNCILSCLTLRRLHLEGISVKPIHVRCTLPNVTSLCFKNFEFDSGDFLVDVPMLDHLSFTVCDNLSNCNISAQKLDSLDIKYCQFDQLPVNLDLRSVRTLDLGLSSLQGFVNGYTRRGLQLQPPALNVEYLMLSTEYAGMDDDTSSAFIHLLRICPKLRQLDMGLAFSLVARDWLDPKGRLLKEFHTVAQQHKILNTLKLDTFKGCDTSTLFIKELLTCFPTLEKVVITPADICKRDEAFERNMLELLDFPCASTKAEIVYSYK